VTRRKTDRCFSSALVCMTSICTLLSPPAWALPSLTPHDHGDGKVYYEADAVKDGDNNHNHLFNKDPKYCTDPGFVWDADEVWDNRSQRIDRTALTLGAAELQTYAHGFIEDDKKPRFKFMDGDGSNVTFDAAKKKIVTDNIDKWVAAAKAQSAGKKTPDGTPLVTGVGLEATEGDTFEIRIGFFHNLLEQQGTVGLWMVIPNQRWAGGGSPTKAELEKTPILAFDDSVSWLFDTSKTPTGNQIDFATVSLHELGHVLGLGHAPDNPAGNLMRSGISEDAMNGKTMRDVDISSARGVAGLYTQPVPEPATLAMAALVLAWPVRAGIRSRQSIE
jgi:hypothetical protein